MERKLFDDSNAVFDVPPRINEWNRTNLKRTGKESIYMWGKEDKEPDSLLCVAAASSCTFTLAMRALSMLVVL